MKALVNIIFTKPEILYFSPSNKHSWRFLLHVVRRSLLFCIFTSIMFLVLDYYYYNLKAIICGSIIAPMLYCFMIAIQFYNASIPIICVHKYKQTSFLRRITFFSWGLVLLFTTYVTVFYL